MGKHQVGADEGDPEWKRAPSWYQRPVIWVPVINGSADHHDRCYCHHHVEVRHHKERIGQRHAHRSYRGTSLSYRR